MAVMVGKGAMTNSIEELAGTDFLLVAGSNTTEAHPIIAMEMKRAVNRGATLIVADPRAIWLTKIADIHMQLKPGTDGWLLNDLAQGIDRKSTRLNYSDVLIADDVSRFKKKKRYIYQY